MENTLSFNGDFYFSLVSLRAVGEHNVEQNKEIFTKLKTGKSLSVFLDLNWKSFA